MDHREEFAGTLLGIIAIVLWGSMIAVYTELIDKLGLFTAGALVFMLGGGLGLLHILVVQRAFRRLFQGPPVRLLLQCLCVVSYIIGLNFAIGLVTQPQQILTVSLINYLWPALTLLLSVPILHKRASIGLLPGTMIALSGVAIATFPTGNFSFRGLLMQWQTAWLPFLCVLVAAIAWACYSNLARRWAADAEISRMPLFLFVTGLLSLVIRGFFHEHAQWTPTVAWSLLFAALGPTLLAYKFWDIAMRQGRVVLVVSLSYLTPLLSTVVLCVYLRVAPGGAIWLACGLIILGAIICNASVHDRKKITVSG